MEIVLLLTTKRAETSYEAHFKERKALFHMIVKKDLALRLEES